MTRSILAAGTALGVLMAAASAAAAGQPDGAAAAAAWVDPIYVHLGEAVTGTLAEGDSHTDEDGFLDRYVLDLEVGAQVEVVMRSAAFDTFLVAGFLGAEGFEQIALDDDGLGEGLNSRLRFRAAEAGRYEIRARGFAGLGAGEYALRFSERAPLDVVAPVGSIAVGGAVTGALSADDAAFDWAEDYRYDAYRFRAHQGEPLEAVVRSSEFDTTLMVMSESRWGVVEQLTFDDDGLGEGTDSRIRFYAPSDGDYELRVSSFGPGQTGAYRLALNPRAAWPEPVAITLGLPMSGEIGSGDAVSDDDRPFDAYALTAAAGQRFEILANSPAFPTSIEIGRLGGVNGWEPLAYGDNYLAGQTSSRLLFSPTEAGDYVVRIGGSEPAMRGEYSLVVNDRGPLPPTPPPGSISVGDSLAGTLAEGDGVTPEEKYFDEFDVRASAGQRLSVTVRSDVFDTYLEIYRRQDDGTYLIAVSDDDGGGDLDSRSGLTTDGGDYRIRVTSFAAGEAGYYSLAVRDLGPPAPPSPMALGQAVEGAITASDYLTETEGPYDSYGFTAAEGERIQFVARSEAFDTFLIVARRDGERFEFLHYDDDGMGDGTTNSRLTFIPEEAGDYELWVMPLDPATLGAYSLESRNLGPTPSSTPLAMGATVSGELREGDGLSAEGTTYDGYTFQGAAGQRILLNMYSAAFDTFLLLGMHGEDGLNAIGENDDFTPQETSSSITMTLPRDALYEVWATSHAVGETGRYSLTLTDLGPEPEPGSLLVGSTIRGTLGEQDPVGADGAYFDAFRFVAEAGQPIRITATSNAFDTYLQLGRMDGRVFTVDQEDDDGLSDLNSLISFTPETAGPYVVRVRSYASGETGAYVLTVEDAPTE